MLVSNNVSFNGLFTCKRTNEKDKTKFVELAKGQKKQYAYKGDTRVHNLSGEIVIGTHLKGHDETFLRALNKEGFKCGVDFTYEADKTLPVNSGPEMKPKSMVQILSLDDANGFNIYG